MAPKQRPLRTVLVLHLIGDGFAINVVPLLLQTFQDFGLQQGMSELQKLHKISPRSYHCRLQVFFHSGRLCVQLSPSLCPLSGCSGHSG